MKKQFLAFLTRGNVIDLAVAVVVGMAFGQVIDAVVKDLLTPLLSIPGGANFASLHFVVHGSTFAYGDVLNAFIAFVAIAFMIFLIVVYPVTRIQSRRAGPAVTRPCPECLSEVPVLATRCAFCTSEIPAAPSAT